MMAEVGAEVRFVAPAEVEDVELYHATSFITKYVFSQDAKVIAIQYSLTAIAIGLVALVLSWLMRLQLGFPDSFSFIDPADYYQFITMHGMIMVVYLLTALFLGGFGNYLIPLMVGARDMVFPYVNMLSYWIYLLAVLVLSQRQVRQPLLAPLLFRSWAFVTPVQWTPLPVIPRGAAGWVWRCCRR